MDYQTIHQIFFSPSGTTRQVTNKIAAGLEAKDKKHDLLDMPIFEPIKFASDDILLIGMPVFSGRIPHICLSSLNHLHGQNTLAIACVVYGNRGYDDALCELTELLEKQGFIVIAAAAFIGQHSIFNQVAANRPDNDDYLKIERFAKDCLAKIIGNTDQDSKKLKIKGDHPYLDYKKLPFVPVVNNKCNNCGKCASICPVKAIDAHNPQLTNENKCISCTACISGCPQNARAFDSPLYHDRSNIFTQANFDRKEPVCFL